jgi:hypothetical protein
MFHQHIVSYEYYTTEWLTNQKTQNQSKYFLPDKLDWLPCSTETNPSEKRLCHDPLIYWINRLGFYLNF